MRKHGLRGTTDYAAAGPDLPGHDSDRSAPPGVHPPASQLTTGPAETTHVLPSRLPPWALLLSQTVSSAQQGSGSIKLY